MLKVTIPEKADLYAPLIAHRTGRARGGAVRRLFARGCLRQARQNHGMIASFSRALLGDLRVDQDDATFDATLKTAIDEIYKASTEKA